VRIRGLRASDGEENMAGAKKVALGMLPQETWARNLRRREAWW
jgi:hypothetical protein